MKSHLLFLFTAVYTSILVGQSFGKIRCQVIDVSSKQPVVYATIVLVDHDRGTHADFDGFFEIPRKYFADGVIMISSIGYQSKQVKLSTLDNSKTNIISLTVAVESLNGVELVMKKKRKKKLTARKIIKKAIEQIPMNYPTKPHAYIGYYRDYQQPANDLYQKLQQSSEPIEYVNLHEGIIGFYDGGFQTNRLKDSVNQSVLYSFFTNQNFPMDSTLTVPYDNSDQKYAKHFFITPLGGNELNILHITNAIRNYNTMSFSFVDYFERDFLINHKFSLKETVYQDDIGLHEISFTSNPSQTGFLYKSDGKIYIDNKDFAIYKLSYNTYYKNKDNPKYNVTIEYKRKEGLMYLNYITFNNYFDVANENAFKMTKAAVDIAEGMILIELNNKIDPRTLRPWQKNIAIFYEDKKLKINNVSLDPFQRSIVVYLKDKGFLIRNRNNPDFIKELRIELKNIKDFNGFTINELNTLQFNQFRELFVQEVFVNKPLSNDKIFIDKLLPLSKAAINKEDFNEAYWINTPLKTIKKKQ